MPLSSNSRESAIERLLGWLTIALGIGMLIPRPGLGLYSILQASGDRILWSAAMNFFGVALIVASYFPTRVVRVALLFGSMLFWSMLALRFIDANLWGATLQAFVVILFSNSVAWRLWRIPKGS